MRRQHWFLPILSLSVLIANSANALADDGYDDYDPDTSYREAVEYGPDVQGNFSTALKHEQTPYYTSQDLSPPPEFDIMGYDPSQVPSHAAVVTGANGQHQLPPQFGPYPEISPFDNGAFQQHSMENGLWMKETRGPGRHYNFGVDVLFTNFRKPVDRPVGSNAVPHKIFYPDTAATNFWLIGKAYNTRDIFDQWDLQNGVKVHWGFEDPDETGFKVTAFWTGEFEDIQDYGDINAPASVNNVSALSAILPGLPLDDGIGGTDATSNTNALYDRGVRYTYSQEAFGTQLNWIMSPKISRRNWQLQTLYGLRYLGIREGFSFLGRGSGLNYTTTFITPPDIGSPPTIGGTPTVVTPPFEGLIIATTKSHLFGPEGGFTVELGGDRLKILSTTKVGLMANRERTDLQSRGLGNHFSPDFDPDHETSYTETTTHVSPLIDFSVMVEANIFPIVPVVKRWKILRDAKLRGGWQILNVWEVQRPTDAIVYRAPPEDPFIQSRRTSWNAQMWHLGVIWEK